MKPSEKRKKQNAEFTGVKWMGVGLVGMLVMGPYVYRLWSYGVTIPTYWSFFMQPSGTLFMSRVQWSLVLFVLFFIAFLYGAYTFYRSSK